MLARNKGTEIHNALECSFKSIYPGDEYEGIANKVKAAVFEYFGVSDGWIAEESFAHSLGFGGKVDLHNKIGIVLDFKTKEEFKLDKKGNIARMAYDEQCMQLAAYSVGLQMGIDARIVNVFVDYNGETVFHEWSQDDWSHGWDMFIACLELWKLKHKFNPEF